MNAYIDSSVVLRLVLGQPGALVEWSQIARGVASALVEVECLRTIDRLRLLGQIDDRAVADRRQAVFRLLRDADVVDVGPGVLSRASQPLPVAVGTLDAIHLATALLWREARSADLVMATHDATLALAARACDFAVVGGG